MKMGFLIKLLLTVIALWGMADSALAAVTCKYENIQPADGSMPLQVAAITVGRDLPLGSEVFRQGFRLAGSQLVAVTCTPFPFTHHYEVTVSAVYPKAAWTTGPYANKVYKTDIDGIGVVFEKNGIVFPWKSDESTSSSSECTPGKQCIITLSESSSAFDIVLLKIGKVSPGFLQGNRLPLVSMYYNVESNRNLLWRMKHSGNIQIVANTCNTPDVPVPMGTYQLKEFKKIGSATGWKDFNIALKNCPAFHGTYGESGSTWVSQGGKNPAGEGYRGFPKDNNLQLRIDPTRPAINAQKGVLSLDPSGTGSTPAATGIGVQIADSVSEPLPLATVRNTDLYLRSSEGDYSIPLRARYLQTSSTVKPGPANASATFTIIYH